MKMAGIKWVTLLVLVFGAVSVSAQSDLTVKVKNIRSAKGKVMIAADKGQYAMADATGDTVTLVLKEVPEGKCKLYRRCTDGELCDCEFRYDSWSKNN